jgi:arylsulfatase A
MINKCKHFRSWILMDAGMYVFCIMTHLQMIRRSDIFYVFLLMVCVTGCSPTIDQKTGPNIIYIMADDMGYGDLGCYGQEMIQTPNIDRLAINGIKFTQHYAGNTVCAPSRCALMTGYHMGHAQIRGNRQAEPSGQWPISPGTVTVAKLLKSAGYKTAMIGKWGLGIEGSTGDPMKQGFDDYYGYLDQVLAHNYYPEYLLRNGKREYLNNEVQYLDTSFWHKGLGSYATRKSEYSHDLFLDEALQYLAENNEKPFFLYLPFTIPHDNGEAPAGERMEVPAQGLYAEEDWTGDTKRYAAKITRMDRGVGMIMKKLEELGIEGNTLVLFTSDNGPMPGEEFTGLFNSNGIFRGGKRDVYEGGIRVPLIATWKGIIKPGRVSDHVSAFWDFLPTACDLAGIDVPAGIDGISYLPELLGLVQPGHEYLYWEFPSLGGKQAIRRGKWKLVKNNCFQQDGGEPELFDLEHDPGELNDLSDEYPELVRELTGHIETVRTESDIFPFYER